MKYWKYSLLLGIFSIAILFISLCLPATYSVFAWKAMGAEAGVLFPFLLASWMASLISIGCNVVFVDLIYMRHEQPIKRQKKYLPSILSMPALFSFMWFCYRWYRGAPMS